MFCKNCGKEIKDGIKFCPNCGAPTVNENAEMDSNESQFVKTGKKINNAYKKVCGAIGSLAAIVAVVLVVMALTGKFDDMGAELGELSFVKGNDTKSSLADNTAYVVRDDTEEQTEKTATEEPETESEEIVTPAPEPEPATVTIQPLNIADYAGNDTVVTTYNHTLDGIDSEYGVQWYSLYDMDADGMPELFVSEGFEQKGEVYTIKDGEAYYLGSFNGDNTSLYVDPDTGDVVAAYGYMGTEVLTYMSKNESGLTVSEQPYRELGPDEDYYTTPYHIECVYVSNGDEY